MQDELFNCCLRCGLGSPLRCQIILESFSSQIWFRRPFACSTLSILSCCRPVPLRCQLLLRRGMPRTTACATASGASRLPHAAEKEWTRTLRLRLLLRTHCDGYRHDLNLQCSRGFFTCLFSRRTSRDTKVTSTATHCRGEKRIPLYRVHEVESLC